METGTMFPGFIFRHSCLSLQHSEVLGRHSAPRTSACLCRADVTPRFPLFPGPLTSCFSHMHWGDTGSQHYINFRCTTFYDNLCVLHWVLTTHSPGPSCHRVLGPRYPLPVRSPPSCLLCRGFVWFARSFVSHVRGKPHGSCPSPSD